MKRLLASVAFAAAVSSAGPTFAQDAAAGEKVFSKCRPCHMVGEKARNGVGPILNGVIGRPAGSLPGYNFSAANKNSGLTWDEATFLKYIAAPRDVVKGTKMAFAGIKNPTEAANLLAYLKQFDASGKKR